MVDADHEAEAARKAGDAELVAAAKKREKLQAVIDGDFKPLKNQFVCDRKTGNASRRASKHRKNWRSIQISVTRK